MTTTTIVKSSRGNVCFSCYYMCVDQIYLRNNREIPTRANVLLLLDVQLWVSSSRRRLRTQYPVHRLLTWEQMNNHVKMLTHFILLLIFFKNNFSINNSVWSGQDETKSQNSFAILCDRDKIRKIKNNVFCFRTMNLFSMQMVGVNRNMKIIWIEQNTEFVPRKLVLGNDSCRDLIAQMLSHILCFDIWATSMHACRCRGH